MNVTQVQLSATVYVQISLRELDTMTSCAVNHYDHKVKSMADQGGVLYGIRNRFVKDESLNPLSEVNVGLTFVDLDLMAKALEIGSSLPSAKKQIMAFGLHERVQDRKSVV